MAVYYFRNAGVNWGDAANWSLTDGGGATGAVPTATDDALFTANSGNCTVNASARVCKTLDFTGYTNTITMTFGITVSGSVTLEAAMTIAGASGLTVNETATITSNGKTWPNALTLSGASKTITLGDNWTVNGTLTSSGSTSQIVNGNTIYSNGLSISGNYTLSGTTTFELTGGTLGSFSGLNTISNNISINGNVTLGGSFNWTYSNGIFKYISGNVIYNIVPTFNNCSLDLGLSFIGTNITLINTITLLSNLNIGGILVAGGTGVTINGTFNINTYGGLSIQENYSIIKGTGSPVLNLYGGIWRSTLSNGFPALLQLDTNIIGNINITGRLVCYNTGTLTYIKGIVKVDDTSALRITGATTLINCNKAIFKTVIITSGVTVTMNNFFSGSALIPIRIQSSTAGSNYTIAFQDGFEKITKFTKISNCTVTNRGQLLCITDKSNKGGNVGVRYINQMPNRVALNSPTTTNPLGYATSTYLLSDPNTILI